MRKGIKYGILIYLGIQVLIKFHYAKEWEVKDEESTTPLAMDAGSTIDFRPAIIPMDTSCQLHLPEIENPEDYDLEPITDF